MGQRLVSLEILWHLILCSATADAVTSRGLLGLGRRSHLAMGAVCSCCPVWHTTGLGYDLQDDYWCRILVPHLTLGLRHFLHIAVLLAEV